MNRILLLFLISLFFYSCKTQYATFQEVSRPIMPTRDKAIKTPIEKINTKSPSSVSLENLSERSGQVEVAFEKRSIPILIEPEPVKRKVYTWEVTRKVETVQLKEAKLQPIVSTAKGGKKFKKVGSNLLVGIVFLAIAVVLSFINLTSLAVLFALASIVFLVIGIKNLWRKRKNNKKKKERKEFFEDLLN